MVAIYAGITASFPIAVEQAIARFDRWSISAIAIFHQPSGYGLCLCQQVVEVNYAVVRLGIAGVLQRTEDLLSGKDQ